MPDIDLSGVEPSVEAEVDVSVPDTPNVDAKKPKKKIFSKIFKRLSSKAKLEVSIQSLAVHSCQHVSYTGIFSNISERLSSKVKMKVRTQALAVDEINRMFYDAGVFRKTLERHPRKAKVEVSIQALAVSRIQPEREPCCAKSWRTLSCVWFLFSSENTNDPLVSLDASHPHSMLYMLVVADTGCRRVWA